MECIVAQYKNGYVIAYRNRNDSYLLYMIAVSSQGFIFTFDKCGCVSFV